MARVIDPKERAARRELERTRKELRTARAQSVAGRGIVAPLAAAFNALTRQEQLTLPAQLRVQLERLVEGEK